MDKEEMNIAPEEQPVSQQTGYKPRPLWQVWAARIGLVLFLIVLVVYYLVYFRGGL